MFKTFLTEVEIPNPEQEYFTKEDILEMIDLLDEEELQEIGEEIMEIFNREYEDEEYEDEEYEYEDEDITEKKYFAKKAREVNREKKIDKATKRKLAKKRKLMYKKNKAKIKRANKKYRKKVKRQPNSVRTHR